MSEEYITRSPYTDIRLEDCIWYHSYEFNRNVEGLVVEYDQEQYLKEMLLPENMDGQTFLDIGTASGFYSFEMERRGADVISYDLGVDDPPDQITYSDSPDRTEDNHGFIDRLHKGYWYAHRYFNSKARAVYGSVMRMPDWLPRCDVTLMGSVLQHLRDPVKAIQEADRHTKHTLIVSEAYYKSKEPILRFEADPEGSKQWWTWWRMSPPFLTTMLKTLGYKKIEVCGPFNMANLRCTYDVTAVTVKGTR